MIPITLQVKESAYDKIIYLLSHLQDDVTFNVEKNNINTPSEKLRQLKTLERLATLDKLVAQSNNTIQVTRELSTDTDGMVDDIS